MKTADRAIKRLPLPLPRILIGDRDLALDRLSTLNLRFTPVMKNLFRDYCKKTNVLPLPRGKSAFTVIRYAHARNESPGSTSSSAAIFPYALLVTANEKQRKWTSRDSSYFNFSSPEERRLLRSRQRVSTRKLISEAFAPTRRTGSAISSSFKKFVARRRDAAIL